MCGIFGYVGASNKATHIVLSGLKDLEYRGYDSWGIAVVPEQESAKTIIVKKSVGKIGTSTIDDLPLGTLAFGHTRWATHGGVSKINAHPHLDCTKSIALIHNGIVENNAALKKMLLDKKHTFLSETDSEVIVHLIEEYAKTTMFSKAVQRAFNELEGLNAIIVINKKDHQMIAVRNGSPLVVGFGDKENYLSSDPTALIPYTKQVHFLEDNEMAIVDEKNIHIYDVKTGDHIWPRKQMIDWTVDETVKGKYPYYMLKEIYEQPGLLSEIASESHEQSDLLAQKLKASHRAYVIGAGTAGHAARAASYLFSHIADRLVNWGIANEFDHRIALMSDKSILIVLSQSGETMDLLEIVKKAKARHITVFALVNVVGSSLWREADLRLPLGAGPEKGVASTKAFITKIAHLLLVAYSMKGEVKKGQLLLVQAAKAAQDVLSERSVDQIKNLAKELKNTEHMFVIGRGISYATALECALKIKEISYIHAEGVAAGELKHGPLALVTKGTICIVFAPLDGTYDDTITAAIEMKARGGYIIGISPKPNDVFDEYIAVADVGIATIIPNSIVTQLLAYYLTLERGFDPDMPRNLAKSVTVK